MVAEQTRTPMRLRPRDRRGTRRQNTESKGFIATTLPPNTASRAEERSFRPCDQAVPTSPPWDGSAPRPDRPSERADDPVGSHSVPVILRGRHHHAIVAIRILGVRISFLVLT